MESKKRHPLECITHSEGLSMLESLIPFVDYPMKLPLALFIKFIEVRLIINAFRSVDTISRIGLNMTSSDPLNMLCALTGMQPEMLRMLMSLSENMNGGLSPEALSGLSGKNGMDFSDISGILSQMGANNMGNGFDFSNQNTPENSPANDNDSVQTSASFDEAIQNILSEYYMAQAETFAQNISEPTLNQEVSNEL